MNVKNFNFYAFKKLILRDDEWRGMHMTKMEKCRKVKICDIWNQKFYLCMIRNCKLLSLFSLLLLK